MNLVTDSRSGPPPAESDLAATARRIGLDVAGPAADEVDRLARFPKEAIDALRDAGLLSAMVPTALGGAGATLSEVAEAIEQIGAHCASTAMIYAMHQIQVHCLLRHGRSAWVEGFLREVVVAQEGLLASATTEKGVGGDVRSSICALQPTSGGFRLEKDAPVISYGAHADAVLATARRTPESAASDQVLVVVPRSDCTLEQTSGWDTLGFRGTCSDGFMLRADGTEGQVLSDPYSDISSQTMLPTSHIVWSSVWLGLATSAVDRAHAYIRAEARKKPGTMPPVAIRLAELAGVLAQMRSLVHSARDEYQRLSADIDQLTSLGFAIRMNSLKTSSSQLVVDIVGKAMLITGIAGYREDSPHRLGRQLRDAYGAALMVNNDRILANSAQLLLVHKGG